MYIYQHRQFARELRRIVDIKQMPTKIIRGIGDVFFFRLRHREQACLSAFHLHSAAQPPAFYLQNMFLAPKRTPEIINTVQLSIYLVQIISQPIRFGEQGAMDSKEVYARSRGSTPAPMIAALTGDGCAALAADFVYITIRRQAENRIASCSWFPARIKSVLLS